MGDIAAEERREAACLLMDRRVFGSRHVAIQDKPYGTHAAVLPSRNLRRGPIDLDRLMGALAA